MHEDYDARTLAHEFGHLLGFRDYYRPRKNAQGLPESVAYPGFEDDLMGTGDRVKVEHLMLLIESYRGRVK